MNPSELTRYLHTLVERHLKISTMIWGPPGIGKSSIVAQVAGAHGLECIDVRLSQLAPTDLRGLPVPADGVSRWYPPEFLPRGGAGILFLDELNMAPPTMQGMAQQLILDRRVGSYVVPDDWFIWAAGNRKEDRASVFDMPAPLANRFLHLEVGPDFESFKAYALEAGMHERLLAFLSFRTTLLHKIDQRQPAWPSPRSWMIASALHEAGLDIASAVGAEAAAEFAAYTELYASLPDLDQILHGEGSAVAFPQEPSARYATVIGLTLRATDAQQAYQGFCWMSARAPAEWVQLFAADLFRTMRARNQMGALAQLVMNDQQLCGMLQEYQRSLMGGERGGAAR